MRSRILPWFVLFAAFACPARAGVTCFTSVPAADGTALCVAVTPLAVVPPPGGFVAGCGQTYRVEVAENGRGNACFVEFPACSEVTPCGPSWGSRLECWLRVGSACAQGAGALTMLPGVRRGAFRDAAADWIDMDFDRRDGICHDTYARSGVINGSRMRVLPVTDAIPSGRGTLAVTGYALFFVTHVGPAAGDVALEYLFPIR